ncbi:MAG: 1-deoxy-D-xylulose-5-phosphate reductoisomerase [Gammaproteobacteria bacterium]|nr:1-deoxy-D-xylulose-5-phosphate reductoisomerase [Gammaproteobacteria bacterium]MCY4281390.1 1-deoxy-D-xylulose-5-phosphate reductoisomerase [Gammaproteobacteria bacterium]MCY4339574.1 1-deoxy-D-xylulose-5-phosphate reductoisomerase [Gammaproteobacteria bacterium]
MIGVTILGSTGSIGVSTLDVMSRHRDLFAPVALTANNNVQGLLAQCLEWRPQYAVMADPDAARQLRDGLRHKAPGIRVLAGSDGLQEVAACAETDYVMAAIVGAAGLLPTLAAAQSGKRVMLANKEALVMSGQLFMDAVRENNACLLPVDSEHNAIFQCMPVRQREESLPQVGVTRILLTASGGPFRTTPLSALREVTADQACAHPNWDMGRKISVDSATMMNKGLEVIEACWLFATDTDNIEVVIHPESIIHSLVEYADGSVLAQLGNPDMRTPIAYALAWPRRLDAGVKRLNLFEVSQLNFAQPDPERFPCLGLARRAFAAGGTGTTLLNAANEVAVAEFLKGRIRYTDIAPVVEQTLSEVAVEPADTLEQILHADQQARACAGGHCRVFSAKFGGGHRNH